MRRSLLLTLPLMLFAVTAFAQQNGTLNVTVQQMAHPGLPNTPVPIAGAEVIVMHWTNERGMQPSLMRDQIATTNPMGQCAISLPPGTYDVFVAAGESAPAAFRWDIKPGQTTTMTASLRSSPLRFRPVK